VADLTALLAQARAAHEGLMTAAGDVVRIHRPSLPVFDQSTGGETPGAELVLYEGTCRVKSVSRAVGTATEAGEQELQLRVYEVAIPWSASLPADQVIKPGDQLLFLAASDPRLTSTTLYVTGRQFGSLASAWRIYAEDREAA
jgi:hypothetical protein